MALLDGLGTVGHFLRFMGHEVVGDKIDEFVWDKSVYNDTRLFRGPLQQKLGDSDTILKLGKFVNGSIENEPSLTAEEAWHPRNPFPYNVETNVTILGGLPAVPSGVLGVPVEVPGVQDEAPDDVVPFNDTIDSFSSLYQMIHNVYWPAYMKNRHTLAKKKFGPRQTLVSQEALDWKLPPSLELETVNGHVRTTCFVVPGDNLCLCDPSHRHLQNPVNKTSFQIDLGTFVVKQLCWVCGADQSVSTPLVSDGTSGAPGSVPRTSPHPLAPLRDNPNSLYSMITKSSSGSAFARFFVAYIRNDIVFRPLGVKSGGDNFFVYTGDEGNNIWMSDTEAIWGVLYSQLDTFIITLAKDLASLVQTHTRFIDDHDEEDDEILLIDTSPYRAIDAIGKKWRDKEDVVKTVVKMSGGMWSDKATVMDPHTTSVFMSNGQVFDVLTGKIRDIRKEDLCTATIESSLLLTPDGSLDVDHPECKEIDQWFLDIATNREDLATYLKRLVGYSFAQQVFDRKFYVLYGSGSDGKSTLGKFFQECLGHSKYFSVPPSFFSDFANKNTGAEAATSNAAEFAGKTCCMTEDMSCGVLQSGKLKSYSAGDRISGRKLYKNTTSWKQTGKLWFATNVDPTFSVLDQAIIDRLVIIPMDTRWVRNPDPAFGEKQADTVYLDRLTTYRDAFATVVLHAVCEFFKSNDNVATFFPIPACVKARTEKFVIDNHAYKRFIKECLDTDKVMVLNDNSLLPSYVARGVMSVYTMYQSFKSHVSAKGDKVEYGTEREFVKQMQMCNINVDASSKKYPYYHKLDAQVYCGEWHTVAPYNQVRVSNVFNSVPPAPKRHCPARSVISADQDV